IGLSGLGVPHFVDVALDGVGQLAAPASLLVLGMGLADYGVTSGWRESVAITMLKLIVQPLVVWAIAALLGLPALETSVVVLLASLSVGVNVYLMSVQFQVLQSTVATTLVLSTAVAALTTPVLLTLMHIAYG